MQFKKSAGVFLTGLILSVVGGVGASMAASAAAAASMAASLSRFSSGPNPTAAVMAFIFGLISLVGFILLCQGAYRALVKIDALPVPAPAPEPEAAVRPVVAAE